MRSFFIGLLVCSSLVHAASSNEQWLIQLTDTRPIVHDRAVEALVSRGPRVIADLRLLATSKDPLVRSRLILVASRVGGDQAREFVLGFQQDPDSIVRELTALSFGSLIGPETFRALHNLMVDEEPSVREAAALAFGMQGDPQAIYELLFWDQGGRLPERMGDRILGRGGEYALARLKKAMRASLQSLCAHPTAVPVVIGLLERLQAKPLQHVLEASFAMGDPRLCAPLIRLAASSEVVIAEAAVTSLAANGDTRCLALLCQLAQQTDHAHLADAAARTLRRLTGHHAPPGVAWSWWWEKNADRVASLLPRDEFLAALRDSRQPLDQELLASFDPTLLQDLVDGALGSGPYYWQQRAWHILRADQASRWTPVLQQRYASAQAQEKLALVVLMDALDDPQSNDFFAMELKKLDQIAYDSERGHPQGSLRAALGLALR